MYTLPEQTFEGIVVKKQKPFAFTEMNRCMGSSTNLNVMNTFNNTHILYQYLKTATVWA